MLDVPETSFHVDVRSTLPPFADEAVIRLNKARRELEDCKAGSRPDRIRCKRRRRPREGHGPHCPRRRLHPGRLPPTSGPAHPPNLTQRRKPDATTPGRRGVRHFCAPAEVKVDDVEVPLVPAVSWDGPPAVRRSDDESLVRFGAKENRTPDLRITSPGQVVYRVGNGHHMCSSVPGGQKASSYTVAQRENGSSSRVDNNEQEYDCRQAWECRPGDQTPAERCGEETDEVFCVPPSLRLDTGSGPSWRNVLIRKDQPDRTSERSDDYYPSV
jgi:hypothetical protein